MYRWKNSVNKWQIYHMSSLILVTSSKKYMYIIWLAPKWCGFSALSKHAPYLPISWWLDISICFRFSSKSSADQAGAKPCDGSATREGPQARFDATTGTDAARLPGDFTSWTPWIRQLQRLVAFTTTSHMSCHSDSDSHCLPTRTKSNQKKHTLILFTLLTSSLLSRYRSSWNSCRLMERPSNVVFVGHEVLAIDFTETLTYF